MKAGKIIAYILLVLAFVAVCGVIVYFTGGFTSDFKTFYVAVDGKNVLSTADGYELTTETPLTVDVKYTFGAFNKENSGYSVKVVPNKIDGKDFDFTLDGETNFFQSEKDSTKGFDLDRGETSFTIKPKGGIDKILQAVYPDSELEDCRNKAYENMYALVVTSYNGEASVTIYFSVVSPLYEIILDKEVITF